LIKTLLFLHKSFYIDQCIKVYHHLHTEKVLVGVWLGLVWVAQHKKKQKIQKPNLKKTKAKI
jgi:hypothetical protein